MSENNNYYEEMLKEEMDRVNTYEMIIDEMTKRINNILTDLGKEDSFQEGKS